MRSLGVRLQVVAGRKKEEHRTWGPGVVGRGQIERACLKVGSLGCVLVCEMPVIGQIETTSCYRSSLGCHECDRGINITWCISQGKAPLLITLGRELGLILFSKCT